ncbi:MAG: hypothetical protein ACOYM3_28745, partial [Terrimicrobiaceae bacterium]
GFFPSQHNAGTLGGGGGWSRGTFWQSGATQCGKGILQGRLRCGNLDFLGHRSGTIPQAN